MTNDQTGLCLKYLVPLAAIGIAYVFPGSAGCNRCEATARLSTQEMIWNPGNQKREDSRIHLHLVSPGSLGPGFLIG